MTKRFSVCKRGGMWRVYDDKGSWHDSFDSLEEAHSFATACAVGLVLFDKGGLTRLQRMLRLESAWQIDAEYRQRIAEARLQEIRRQACMTS